MAALERGVVHKDIDFAESLDAFPDDVLAVFLAADIAGQAKGLAAGFGDEALGFCSVFLLVEIRDHHVGALAGEGKRHGPADAAIGAGDNSGEILKQRVTGVGVLSVVGHRVHGGGRARRRNLALALEGRFQFGDAGIGDGSADSFHGISNDFGGASLEGGIELHDWSRNQAYA